MGGPNTSGSENISRQQQNLSAEEVALQRKEFAASEVNQKRMTDLEQPAVDRYTDLTKNASSAMQAAAPQIGQIDSSMAGARQNILNTIAPGGARDKALADLQIQSSSQKASFINQQTTSAYDKLANLGAGFGAFSLGQGNLSLGLGNEALSGLAGASNTEGSIMQAQAAAKQSLDSIFGSMFGAVGQAAGGYAMKH